MASCFFAFDIKWRDAFRMSCFANTGSSHVHLFSNTFMNNISLHRISTVVLSLISASVSTSVFACASCGCTLSSDWENQGFSTQPGWKLDLRYDQLNQDQLRSGRKTISPGAASQVVTSNGNQEVEKYTKNKYYTATIDYSSSADWGVSLLLPYIERTHSTLGTNSDGATPGGLLGNGGGGEYDSKTSSLGDVKVIGRYHGFSPQRNFGILFGLKLPTGSFSKTGTSTDVTAPGSSAIDPGLQPGTGSTDLILGAYYFDALSKDFDYFTQATVQTTVKSRNGYTPGTGYNLNLGLRYMGFESVIPQLQLNARYVEHDAGTLADQISTGGTLAYLSPGIVMPLTKQASIYGFVQVPVYQNVRGVQLTPHYTASAGVRFSF
ncbi:MAG: TonB-dependent receptor [Betaproteobacteria bacterium]